MRTRLYKELRTLAVPALAVCGATVVAPLLALMMTSSIRVLLLRVAEIGFILGPPFLAALSFGAEYQQGTMALLLVQPVSRTRLWLEKWGVLAAVLAVLALCQYAVRQSGPSAGATPRRELIILVLMLCSAPFWTLVAGSTIGGLAFGGAVLWVLELGGALVVGRWSGDYIEPFSSHPGLLALRLAYGAAMPWLGWRTFVRLELKGHAERPGASAVGSSVALGWLRCRPAGAVRNLARKELRLQQPTFQIAGLFVLGWLAAIAYLTFAGEGSGIDERAGLAQVIFTLLLATYVPVALVVSGTISLSDEATLGTRAWHLTLPASSRVQWLVKLAVTTLVAGALAGGLPVLMVALASAALALPDNVLQLPRSPQFLALLCSVVAFGFWASALFGHTVRAAVATGVALLGAGLVASAASWAGMRLGAGSDLMTSLMIRNQWPPDAFHPWVLMGPRALDRVILLIACTVAGTLILRQSLKAFRRLDVGRRTIFIYGVQLAAVLAATYLLPAAYLTSAGRLYRSEPVQELQAALQSISPAIVNQASPGRSVPVAELEATGLLSAPTRAWLRGSTIDIKAHVGRPRPGGPAQLPEPTPVVAYTARIVFPNQREFRTFYHVGERTR